MALGLGLGLGLPLHLQLDLHHGRKVEVLGHQLSDHASPRQQILWGGVPLLGRLDVLLVDDVTEVVGRARALGKRAEAGGVDHELGHLGPPEYD